MHKFEQESMKGVFMFCIISSSLAFLAQLSKGLAAHPVILLADNIEHRFNICVSYM